MLHQKMKNIEPAICDSKKNMEKCDANSDSEQSETEEASTTEVISNKNLLKEIEETLISIISKTEKIKKPETKKRLSTINIFLIFPYMIIYLEFKNILVSKIILL